MSLGYVRYSCGTLYDEAIDMKRILYCMIIVLCGCVDSAMLSAFSTLRDAITYAERAPEKTPFVLRGTLRSIFDHWYAQPAASSDGRARVARIRELARELTRVHDDHTEGPCILRVPYTAGDSFYIWGNLQGAFHSFVRGLQELQAKGVINDDGIIQGNQSRIIVNGNIFGITRYTVETCLLVLLLMKLNPTLCHFIQGPYEHFGSWLDQGLFEEARAYGCSEIELLELQRELSALFKTLPLALYVCHAEQAPKGAVIQKVIRISAVTDLVSSEQQHQWGSFFEGDLAGEQVRWHCLGKARERERIHSSLRAVITTFDGISDFQPNEGLVQIAPENGAITWALFSANTPLQQHINHYSYDAFALLQLESEIKNIRLTLMNRAYPDGSWRAAQTYLATSAQELFAETSHKQQETVLIGASFDLSKSAKTLGLQLRDGALAALQEDHSKNRSSEHVVRLVFFDDASNTRIARENVARLEQEYDTKIVCFPIGSAMVANYLDKIRNNSLLLLFPVIGLPALRTSEFKGVLYLRPSFEPEVKVLLEHAYKNASGKRFAFFFQDDEFGQGAMDIARTWMRAHAITDWLELPYPRNSISFTGLVEKLGTKSLDALFMFSLPIPTREFIQQAGVDALFRIFQGDMYGISLLGGSVFRSFIQRTGLRMITTHVVPDPVRSNLPIVKEYRAAMDMRHKAYGTFSLEGYLGTRLLLEAIRKSQNPITMERIRTWFETLQNFNLGGMTFTYNYTTRELHQSIWLEEPEHDGWTEYRPDSLSVWKPVSKPMSL